MIEVHGEQVEAPTVGQCLVCSSRYREDCDRLLVGPNTYAGVVELLPEGANLCARNVADHLRNEHVPVEAAAIVSLRTRDARPMVGVVPPGHEERDVAANDDWIRSPPACHRDAYAQPSASASSPSLSRPLPCSANWTAGLEGTDGRRRAANCSIRP